MHAQKMQSPVGECSFCALRNLPKFCKMIPSCVVMVGDDDMYTVTWQPNNTGLGYDLLSCHPPREMTEWFKNTPTHEIRKIASQMVRNVFNQKQK